MSSIFLSKAFSYGTAVERVEIIQTHVSLVFLAGDCPYKLKRAMKFPYFDFSTVHFGPDRLLRTLRLHRDRHGMQPRRKAVC
jgi:uncharacterized protein